MNTVSSHPTLDVDIFSEPFMDDPYPHFRELRDAGPAVWMPKWEIWAVSRYEDVRNALADWEAFSSSSVAFNDQFSGLLSAGVLGASPPRHDQLRAVLSGRLAPRALRSVGSDIEARADELVTSLVDRGSFDAVADLARMFPVSVVADLIGLPTEGRDQLLRLLDANFDAFGPDNERTQVAMPQIGELFGYVLANGGRESLAEGSMGMAVYEAVDRGELDAQDAPGLLMAYVTAGMDTTIKSIGCAVWLMGEHPDQWELLRAEPQLIPQAFNEILRFESPVQQFCRRSTRDWALDEYTVPAGSDLAIMFGSANRDERKWDDPDRFDIRRSNLDHVAFGYGIHACAGQGLARLEAHAVLSSLVTRVERIEAGTPVRHYNNVLRGLESLPVTVVAA